MTPASFTYVALGLHLAVGFPVVWASAAFLAKRHTRVTRVLVIFGFFVLCALAGLALALLQGRLWLALLPSRGSPLLAPLLLTSIIGMALLVFAAHAVILRRAFQVPRQASVLTVAIVWVSWYAVAALATQVAAEILL